MEVLRCPRKKYRRKMQDHFIMAPLRAEKVLNTWLRQRTSTVAGGLETLKEKKACVDIFVQAAGSNLLPKHLRTATKCSDGLTHFWVQILDPKWSQPSKNLLLIADVLQADLLHWHDCECNTCVSAKSTNPPTQIQEVCQLFPSNASWLPPGHSPRKIAMLHVIHLRRDGCKHRTSAQSR